MAQKKEEHWSEIKEKGAGLWRLRFLLFIYKTLGKIPLKITLYPVVFFFFLLYGKTRRVSRDYLDRLWLFAKKKSGTRITKPHFFSPLKHMFFFADSLIDKIASWSGRIARANIKTDHQDVLDDIDRKLYAKKGIFLICSHLGNTEALRGILSLEKMKKRGQKIRINSIIQTGLTKNFEKILKLIHPEMEANVISATEIDLEKVLTIKEKVSTGEILVTAGDRTAAKNKDYTFSFPFLGKKAAFPIGTFTLASLLEVPVYHVFLLKEKGDVFTLYVYPSKFKRFPSTKKERRLFIQNLGKEYVAHLQDLCLKYPYQWYNFFNFWS